MQGAALLRVRQRLVGAGLRLWSEGAMVQVGARVAALVGTGRGSGCGDQRRQGQWRLGWLKASLWEGEYEMTK